jgi:hypothetical protein
MKSRLTKRIASLEIKAAGSTPVHTLEDAATMAAGIEAVRRGFATVHAEIGRRYALPLAEQLRIAQNDLNGFLAEQAEQGAQTTKLGTSTDDNGWLKLKEKFKRSWIQQLETQVQKRS